MRHPQRELKPSEQLFRYRPSLDTLEDRTIPGNTFIGPAGFEMPLSITGQRLRATVAPKQTTAVAAAKTAAGQVGTSFAAARQAAQKYVKASFAQRTEFVASARSGVASSLSAFGDSRPGSTTQTITTPTNTSNPVLDQGATHGLPQAEAPRVGSGSGGLAFRPTRPTDGSNLDAAAGQAGPQTLSGSNSPHSIYNFTGYDSGGYSTTGDIVKANSRGGMTASQLGAVAALKQQIPNLSYTVDTTWGFPTSMVNLDGTLSGPRAGDALSVAKSFILANAQVFNVTPADLNNLKVTDNLTWPIGGGKIVYFTQTVNGIPLGGGVTSAGMRADGSISIVNSNLIGNVASQVNATAPVLTGQQAIMAAALDAGLTVVGGLTSTAPRGTELVPTYLNKSISVDPIPVKLQYLPIAPGDVRLVYTTRFWIPNTPYQFEYHVDAVSGQTLERYNLIAGDSYRVFKSPGATPAEGARQLVVNPADRVASPWGWHDTNGRAGAEYTLTRGNNAFAKYGPLADPANDITPGPAAPQSAPGNVYDWALDLRFNPEVYWQASTSQLFYSMNYYHDVLYRSGFTESTGNFQQNNYGKTATGRQGDYILGVAQSGWQNGDFDNAYFVSAPDGQIGRMAMFQWDITGVRRDGDLDSNIVFHELTHGTANRLVGGSAAVNELSQIFESRGLGEGWADAMALVLNMKPSDNKTTRKTVGNYVLGENASGNGIRNYPYSYDLSISPYTYADGDPQQAPHGDGNGFYSYYTFGEIWVNVVHDLTLNMMENYGFSGDLLNGDAGNNRALKMITLGMALTPDNPLMTASRNGIVAANDMLYGGAYGREIWDAFARRGVGIFAQGGTPDPDEPAENPPIPYTLREDFTQPDFDNLPPPPPPVGGDGSDDTFYEPNETATAAFDLGTMTGANTIEDLAIQQRPLGAVQDRDWFKFVTTKAGVLTITVDVPSSSGDLDVRLYRSLTGKPTSLTEVGIGQGTHRVPGQSETIKVAVGAGQTYYVNILGFNRAFGNYNLIVDAPA